MLIESMEFGVASFKHNISWLKARRASEYSAPSRFLHNRQLSFAAIPHSCTKQEEHLDL